MIVFCKFGKFNYNIIKVYYSITLFNTLKKISEFIFIKKIIYLIEIYILLFSNYFNNR